MHRYFDPIVYNQNYTLEILCSDILTCTCIMQNQHRNPQYCLFCTSDISSLEFPNSFKIEKLDDQVMFW
jgi:hypothetical protein